MNGFTDLPQIVRSVSVVVLAGDTAAMAGLRAELGDSTLLDVVGAVTGPCDAVRLALETDAEVCLLWYRSRGELEDVLPTLQRVPGLALMAALGEMSGKDVEALLRRGVRSVIRQPSDLASLPATIQTFIDNKVYLPLDVQLMFVERVAGADPDAEWDLTPMQARVVPLLARGATTDEIASELGIKPRTVKDHLRRLYGRLDVDNKAQAVAKLARSGYGERP